MFFFIFSIFNFTLCNVYVTQPLSSYQNTHIYTINIIPNMKCVRVLCVWRHPILFISIVYYYLLYDKSMVFFSFFLLCTTINNFLCCDLTVDGYAWKLYVCRQITFDFLFSVSENEKSSLSSSWIRLVLIALIILLLLLLSR